MVGHPNELDIFFCEELKMSPLPALGSRKAYSFLEDHYASVMVPVTSSYQRLYEHCGAH
jgi:hypothetical protein